MEIEQFTEAQLIDFAEQHGCEEVTHWKLERWHKQDVIPRPTVEYLGYAGGTRSAYPTGTSDQVLAVSRLIKRTRNFDVVRFQLWREGYSIPLHVLKRTIRQLVPPLGWKIPHGEEQRYNAAGRRLNALLKKLRGPFFRFLLKRFGNNFENLRSFFEIQLYLSHGIDVVFDEPSHFEDEASAADIFAQGLPLEGLWFLPKDLAADFQNFSNKGLFSIPKLNAALDMAREEDLRRASVRSDLVPLMIEWLDLMGMLPRLLRAFLAEASSPTVLALIMIFFLHLENNGYADNMDGLLEVFRLQMPRFRAFRDFHLALQQELPEVAKEMISPQNIWKQIKQLSEVERELYFTRMTEHLHGVYSRNQADLDNFWLRHQDIKKVIDEGASSTN